MLGPLRFGGKVSIIVTSGVGCEVGSVGSEVGTDVGLSTNIYICIEK